MLLPSIVEFPDTSKFPDTVELPVDILPDVDKSSLPNDILFPEEPIVSVIIPVVTVNNPVISVSSLRVVCPPIFKLPVTCVLLLTVVLPLINVVPPTVKLLLRVASASTVRDALNAREAAERLFTLVRLLLDIEIDPLLSDISPFDIVIFPNLEPEPAVIVDDILAVPVTSKLPLFNEPVVLNWLSAKLIDLLESVILPSEKFKLPNCEPEAAFNVDVAWMFPLTPNEPVLTCPVTVSILFILVGPSTLRSPPIWANPLFTHTAFALEKFILLSCIGAPSI